MLIRDYHTPLFLPGVQSYSIVMKKKLIVFINDSLTILADKGELIENLYNPGDLFEEVHFFITNDDKPDLSQIKKTVGTADLYLHNLPPPSFKRSLGWQPIFLRRWVKDAIDLTRLINPDLIRCQGFNIHTYLAGEVKEASNIPSIVSLHGNPDVDYLRLAKNKMEKFYISRWKKLAESKLTSFDHVIAVYSPVLSYLEQKKVRHCSVIYNIVGINAIPKIDYTLYDRVKCVTVGRQNFDQKDQRDIIRAVAQLENVQLDLFGSGDLHDELDDLVKELNIEDRVFFDSGRSNEELMRTLKDYDIYIYNSINYEISKTVMEAALIGLPIIHNLRKPALSSELDQDYFYLVENSVDGYLNGIKDLSTNQSLREKIGHRAREAALQQWSPEMIENKIVALYTSLLPE
jgi:glycosyltransferase involved in cell wall biosynthesis